LYFRYHIRRLAGGGEGKKNCHRFFYAPRQLNSETSHNSTKSYLPIRYYILSVGLAAVTGIIPLAAGRLGLDEAQGYCWFSRKYSFFFYFYQATF
jgi:hypothetical protein